MEFSLNNILFTNMDLQTQSTFAQVAEENTVPRNHFHCTRVLWNAEVWNISHLTFCVKMYVFMNNHLKNVACVNPSVLNMALDSKHDPGSWIWFRCDKKPRWMISGFGSIISKGPCINTAASNWAPPICVHILKQTHTHMCLQGNTFIPKYSVSLARSGTIYVWHKMHLWSFTAQLKQQKRQQLPHNTLWIKRVAPVWEVEVLLRAFQQPIQESSEGKIKPVDLWAKQFIAVTHAATGILLQQKSCGLMIADQIPALSSLSHTD